MAKPISTPVEGKTEYTYVERELKNVLVPSTRTKEDIKVRVLPFDEFDERHITFAFRYLEVENGRDRGADRAEMANEVAREFVDTFVVHTEDDTNKADSAFNKVRNDARACRTLMGDGEFREQLLAFFINA